jgi:hypothetical protein
MKLISVLVPGLVTIATLSLPATPAIAFSVTQTSDPAQLQTRLFGDTTALNITQFNLGQIPAGFGQFEQAGFFGLSGSGLVMSTGQVDRLAGVNQSGMDLNFDFSSDPNAVPLPGLPAGPRDRVTLDIWFEASQSGRLNFNYVFGSEEWPNSAPINAQDTGDIFRVLLADANNVVRVSKATSVNSAVFNNNPIGNLVTPLDRYTNPISLSVPFAVGRNRLILSIEDADLQSIIYEAGVAKIVKTPDDGYDSAVFLQQISVQTDKPPSVPTPSLLFGLTWMGWRRWRDRHKSR